MDNAISTGKAAKLLGVTVKTLQLWEREGRLVPAARTDSNRRCYTEAQIRDFLGFQGKRQEPVRLVAYCRVTSAAQRPDLANQRRVLEEFVTARGMAGVEFIEEVGGGLNFKRKKFLALMDDIGRGEVKTLILRASLRVACDSLALYRSVDGESAGNRIAGFWTAVCGFPPDPPVIAHDQALQHSA